jgi:hypothetical protein
MILIERIYQEVAAIAHISQDEFSVQFCKTKPSYLRSMKCRQRESSTAVLFALMENLHRRAVEIQRGNSHNVLRMAAEKYEALANEVGVEIARRSMKNAEASKWVRETILRIIGNINESKENLSSDQYETPPIIIC